MSGAGFACRLLGPGFPLLEEFSFLCRKQFGVDVRDTDGSGDGAGSGGAVAGEESDVGDAESSQIRDHGDGFGPDSIAGTNDAEDDAVAGHEQACLAIGIEATQQGRDLFGNRDALFFQQATGADDQGRVAGASRYARARLGLEIAHRTGAIAAARPRPGG